MGTSSRNPPRDSLGTLSLAAVIATPATEDERSSPSARPTEWKLLQGGTVLFDSPKSKNTFGDVRFVDEPGTARLLTAV